MCTAQSIDEIVAFGAAGPMRVSWWLDGQPLTLYYARGSLQYALLSKWEDAARDVTPATRHMGHVPLSIPHNGKLEVVGMAVVSWHDYREIQDPPGRPGELARQGVRGFCQATAGQPRLTYIARGMAGPAADGAGREIPARLASLGFSAVPRRWVRQGVSHQQVVNLQRVLNPFRSDFPALGLVFEHEFPGTETGVHGIVLPWPYDIYSPDVCRLLSATR